MTKNVLEFMQEKLEGVKCRTKHSYRLWPSREYVFGNEEAMRVVLDVAVSKVGVELFLVRDATRTRRGKKA